MDQRFNKKVNALLLLRASKIIREQFRQKTEKHNIAQGHGMILHVLKDKGHLSQVQLSKLLNIKPASVCTLLQNMQKEGLIIREADKKDERIMLSSLSALGKEKAEIVENTWIEIEKEYQEILDQEEQITLRRILFKILEKYDHVEIESKED